MTSVTLTLINSSVMGQKGESQNGSDKKIKHARFSEKRTFSTPCAYKAVRNISFADNLGCFVFL